jgi:prephenate dehydrogenase
VNQSSAKRDASPRRAQIIGTGLIGGSVGLALRQRGWHVSGTDISVSHAERALDLGVIDEVGLDAGAELTLVAVPAAALIEQVNRALAETKGLVTDTGSVKTMVARHISDPRFVPGHPMAGSEQDGVDGADPAIFQGAVWVLTPTEDTDDAALHSLQAILASFGSDVVTMKPERHDSLVAVVSHVPHLTAASLMCLADDRAEQDAPLLRLAAGGFRDMTRIAAGHPAIWLDICDENRDMIVSVLDELTERLQRMRGLVAGGDRQQLADVLGQARRARTNLPARYVRPDELIEVRVPIPDSKGQIAAITMCAADNDVNVTDIEVAHSPEGERGILVMLVPIADSDRLVTALAAADYHPTTRKLA